MSWNPIELRACTDAPRCSLAALACCMAAGLGASSCEDGEPACNVPHDGLAAFIEVRDRNGACTECSAEGGLTFVVGLANGCDGTARFTTPSACLIEDFALIRESGEMDSVGVICLDVISDWELQPGEVLSKELAWGGSRDRVARVWGPLEPGRHRFLLVMARDLTDSQIAPAVESEIVVTQ